MLLTDLAAACRALRISLADMPRAQAALVHPEHLPPMEWLMSGADMVDERVVREWGTPPQKLINAYGPTEGTIGNTLGHVDANTRRSVVGKVYPATTLYICRGNELAYTGAVGEIVVCGPQVATMQRELGCARCSLRTQRRNHALTHILSTSKSVKQLLV